jgi:hypothetical protein
LANTKAESDLVFHILLFKKEKKAELWAADTKNTFLDSFNLKQLPQLPIGQFDLTFDKKDKSLQIQFPNEFYKSKDNEKDQFENLVLGTDHLSKQFFKKIEKAQIDKIIIFPNDNRLGGELNPCFACPHWIAEVYAFLNQKKKEYI